jgi:hypothetical protein
MSVLDIATQPSLANTLLDVRTFAIIFKGRKRRKMTCREKLKLEHPGDLDSNYLGGCWGCPMDYGYHSKALDDCPYKKGGCDVDKSTVPEDICTRCWDREVQEETPVERVYPINPYGENGPAGEEGTSEEEMNKLKAYIDKLADCGEVYAVSAEELRSTIKDSGDRTQFSTGAVRDMHEGKGRCDLMPLDVVARILANHTLVSIASFQKSGQVDYLYDTLKYGSMFGKPEDMFLEVAKHFEDGAKKYGESNWRRGIPVYCYIDSAVRHYLKFLRGDTDERHDRAFVWNILCCIWTVENMPELNNYKKDVN